MRMLLNSPILIRAGLDAEDAGNLDDALISFLRMRSISFLKLSRCMAIQPSAGPNEGKST